MGLAAHAEGAEWPITTTVDAARPENLPRLGALLVRAGLISPEQLEEALEECKTTGARLGAIVVGRGWVGGSDLAHTLAHQCGQEFLDLDANAPDPAAASLLSARLAERYQALPVRFV